MRCYPEIGWLKTGFRTTLVCLLIVVTSEPSVALVVVMALVNSNQHYPVLNLDRVGVEVSEGGSAFCFAGLIAEASIVLGALDDVTHHESVGKTGSPVRAKTVGCVKCIGRASVDRERPLSMIEANDVFSVDRVLETHLDPSLVAQRVSLFTIDLNFRSQQQAHEILTDTRWPTLANGVQQNNMGRAAVSAK